MGALMLTLDTDLVQIERKPRLFKTRLANFTVIAKIVGGLAAMAGAIRNLFSNDDPSVPPAT